MLYCLDTCIVIYAVEGQAPFQQRARNQIAALESAGHRFVISDRVWTECLVHPLGMANGPSLLEYHQFFLGPHLTTISLRQFQENSSSWRASRVSGGSTHQLHQ